MKGQKRPARVDESNSEDDTVGEAIKKLATEGQQMASVMERMQDSQAQQYNSCPYLSVVLISIWKIIRKNELSE